MMGAHAPADPQTSTFACQKCSKRPFLRNRHIESPAEGVTMDSPSLSLGGQSVPNLDTNVPPGRDELQPAGSGKAAICRAAALLRSRCGSNNLRPCDMFSSCLVVDLPTNVEGLGREPSGLFGTRLWSDSMGLCVSQATTALVCFTIVALRVPKSTYSNSNDGGDSSSSSSSSVFDLSNSNLWVRLLNQPLSPQTQD